MADSTPRVCPTCGNAPPSGFIRIDELAAPPAAEPDKPPATVYDPDIDVLKGVLGSKRNSS